MATRFNRAHDPEGAPPGTMDPMSTAAAISIDPNRAVGWRRWLPNAITLSRLVLSLVFFIQLALWTTPQTWTGGPSDTMPTWRLWLAAACFGLAALTDALDGYLARRWGAITRFGRIMDPFADKILVIGAFVMLAGPQFALVRPDGASLQLSGIEPWMVVVMLGRELLVTSIRAVLEAEGQDFSANFTGKLKMVLQSLVIPLVIVVPALTDCAPGSAGRHLIDWAVWITVAATLASGLPYLIRGSTAFRH